VQLIADALLMVLDAAKEAAEKVEMPAKRAFISSGTEAALDDCCDGVLWVRLAGIDAVSTLSERTGVSASRSGCFTFWLARVEIGWAACEPALDARGNPPSAEEVSRTALRNASMTSTLRETIMGFAELSPAEPIVWEPIDADTCSGGTWNFALRTCG
jgi:hypothetical protein